MDKTPGLNDPASDYLPGYGSKFPDDDDDWLTDLDDDIDGMDQFDLGAYAGALK